MGSTGLLTPLMSSQLVYGDGVDDIKEFFSGTFSRAGRRGETGGLCTRPVILGAVLTITSLSSRLDNVDSRHSSNHAKALERIGQVDNNHRETVNQLGNTVQEVDKLQGKVRQSLKEMKIFLNGMGTVAANAVKELNNLKLK